MKMSTRARLAEIEENGAQIKEAVKEYMEYLDEIGPSESRRCISLLERLALSVKHGKDVNRTTLEMMKARAYGHTKPICPEGKKAYVLALCMFALHQRRLNIYGTDAYQEGISIGDAARRLPKRGWKNEIEIMDATDALIDSMRRFSTMRKMERFVNLISQNGIPLDYGMLAEDLYLLDFREFEDEVRTRIAHDYAGEKL